MLMPSRICETAMENRIEAAVLKASQYKMRSARAAGSLAASTTLPGREMYSVCVMTAQDPWNGTE